MLRVDEDSLALHLEVSLATAEPALVRFGAEKVCNFNDLSRLS
jgi:hypothetical protein